MKRTNQKLKFLLFSSLFSTLPVQAALNFCDGNSNTGGSNSFQQNIIKDGVVEIGEIPKGVRNVEIKLTSNSDLDIQLFDKSDNTAIVQWPDGLLKGAYQETTTYNDLTYEWSGFGGDCPVYNVDYTPTDCSYGNEFIKITGTSNRNLVMKAFGYQAGEAKVEYRWDGGQAEGCNVAESGSGQFQQELVEKTAVEIGEIPAGLSNVDIRLTSSNDLDIQLIDKETGEKIVHWPDGLLNYAFVKSINYHDVNYTWSGYAGDCDEYTYPNSPDDCSYGNEYITITGTTNRTLIIKAYGYQSGFADVKYTWGAHSPSADNSLLARYSPILSFYGDDHLPSPIEGFISHSVLYKQTLFGRKAIAYGEALPDKIYRNRLLFSQSFDTTGKRMSTDHIPVDLTNNSGTYFLDYLNEDASPISASDVLDGYEDKNGDQLSYKPFDVMQDYDRVVYGRVLEQGERIYLQYYFFYLVNEWNGNGGNLIGFHEGDWEGMIVELDANKNPLRVGVSIHKKILTFKGGETRSWANVSHSGDHPIVYIGKGGHPTYLHKGRTPVAFGITGTDKHDGTDIVLRNSNTISVDLVNANADKRLYNIINIEEDAAVNIWFNTEVLWGNDFTDFVEQSVKSVKYFDPNRWSNPFKWLNDRD